MTSQQFTIAELGSKFGGLMAQGLSELIVLEKLVEGQQAQIQEITEDKANLQYQIHDLENELAQLKSEIYKLQRAQSTLSSEATEIAASGKKVIANEKEKAAPTEAA
jgi:chromosome segregation ATPase